MISVISAAIMSGLISLAVAKYQQNLKDKSNKTTVVIVKNASDFIKPEHKEVLDEAILLGIEKEPVRQYIKIPIPYPHELHSFFNKMSLYPLSVLACIGTMSLFSEEKLDNYWALPYYFTMSSILLYILYAVLKKTNWSFAGEIVYYATIVALNIFAVCYCLSPCLNFINESCENQSVKIFTLILITTQFSYLRIPNKKPQE